MDSPSNFRARIPFAYQFLFLWLEPFAAFSGSLMALFDTDK